MIRLTKITDYGFILLSQLALNGNTKAKIQPANETLGGGADDNGNARRRFNAKELARQTKLPSPIVGKILKLLTRRGLLVSHRGVKGGYVLARPPDQINVTEVISALEGPIGITECVNGKCSHESACRLSPHWHRINQAIFRVLEGLTLEEIARTPILGKPGKTSTISS